ncbi:MAG: DUF4185 domain-containing protein [Candidatus Acidiferrales bacterium]
MILTETPQERAFNQAHGGNPCREQPCGARFALWPSTIIADPSGNRALIFYNLISAAPGNFNFHELGNSVAIWLNFADQPQRPTINPPVVADHPDLLFSANEPNFGSAALMKQGTLYVYGCGSVGLGKECKLGRVNPANVLDRNAWTFFAGNGDWSTQVGDAVSVFGGDDILNVSWNQFLQRYVAVYSQPLSENVMLRTSPNPEGPWSGEIKAFTAMRPAPRRHECPRRAGASRIQCRWRTRDVRQLLAFHRDLLKRSPDCVARTETSQRAAVIRPAIAPDKY